MYCMRFYFFYTNICWCQYLFEIIYVTLKEKKEISYKKQNKEFDICQEHHFSQKSFYYYKYPPNETPQWNSGSFNCKQLTLHGKNYINCLLIIQYLEINHQLFITNTKSFNYNKCLFTFSSFKNDQHNFFHIKVYS